MLRCARNNPSSPRRLWSLSFHESRVAISPLVNASHSSLDYAWENKRDRQVTAGQPYSNASGKPGEALRYLYWLLAAWQWSTGNSTPCPLFSVPLSLLFPCLRSLHFSAISNSLSLVPLSVLFCLSPAPLVLSFSFFLSRPPLLPSFSHSRSSNSVPLIPFDFPLSFTRTPSRQASSLPFSRRRMPRKTKLYYGVEVIKGYADPRQLLGRSELRGRERSPPSIGVLQGRKQKRPTYGAWWSLSNILPHTDTSLACSTYSTYTGPQ